MKPRIKWAIALLLIGLISAGVMRSLATRQARQASGPESQARQAGLAELASTDIVTVQRREVAQGIPISGSIKAVNSAVIKARVAGQLQGLQVREGDAVKAGQVIARIESGEYLSRARQAGAQAESARAQVTMAQRQYDNNKALVAQGFISTTALDTSLANLNAAQASYRAALAGTEVATQSVDDSILKSPISGQISQRLAQSGERVGIDSKIVEVVDLSRLELEASLGPQESMNVRVGQTAELQIEGNPHTVKATVVRINPSAQAGSRSVLAYLSIDTSGSNAQHLRQGLFAQGTLGTARTAQLQVPISAVRTDKPQPYVQAIENGVVVHKPVALGLRGMADSEPVVAIDGLAEGAQVIRGATGSLREGTQVRFTRMQLPGAAASQPALPVSSPAATTPTP